ncbi:hypothetical protein [Streptomyces sp. NPDC002133]|uniref:hypothetical protein n=1 Tax=Streptomyces sp. NPDC002133 TaxID=3154409 RepID=UPI0033284C5C
MACRVAVATPRAAAGSWFTHTRTAHAATGTSAAGAYPSKSRTGRPDRTPAARNGQVEADPAQHPRPGRSATAAGDPQSQLAAAF